MIKVTYVYSACVIVETEDLSILCDPWITEGIYDGAWFHYPPLNDLSPLQRPFDFIYISHIHPDHYDPQFLRNYLQAFPEAQVVIAPFQPNYLSKKMAADGIPHEILAKYEKGNTSFALFPNATHSEDIDSAMAIRCSGHSLVNMNDNNFCEDQLNQILDFCGREVDIALLSYTGAGPYPQTYYSDPEKLQSLAIAKKEQFFNRYRKMKDYLRPRKTIPFAGKYILGGKLSGLNDFRGVADAIEVTEFDSDAVILADGGRAFLTTGNFLSSAVRTKPYDQKEMNAYAELLREKRMDYEDFFSLPLERMPLKSLLLKAYKNAMTKSHVIGDHYFCIRLTDGEFFVMNANKNNQGAFFSKELNKLQPRSEISIDPRYLFGLLTGVFHWNNAEVGSQYRTTRIPDAHNRAAQMFLSFLHL